MRLESCYFSLAFTGFYNDNKDKNVHAVKCKKSLKKCRSCDTLINKKVIPQKVGQDMARLYKTPRILQKQSFKKHNYEKNKKTSAYDEYTEDVNTVETRLLDTLKSMVDSGSELRLSLLLRKAEARGKSRQRYSSVYGDTIEMLKKYMLHQLDKDADENNIPDFMDLEQAVKDKVNACIQLDGVEDTFGALVYDVKELVSDGLVQKSGYMIDAYTAFLVNGIHIHPDFVGYSLNELSELIEEKYDKICLFREEYENLKSSFAP